MTYEQYWEGDNRLPKYYREKHDLELKEKNFELWLQGFYVREAIMSCVPVLNILSKSKEPLPYRDNPIPLTKAEALAEQRRREHEEMIRQREIFREAVNQFNREFSKKRGGTDGC